MFGPTRRYSCTQCTMEHTCFFRLRCIHLQMEQCTMHMYYRQDEQTDAIIFYLHHTRNVLRHFNWKILLIPLGGRSLEYYIETHFPKCLRGWEQVMFRWEKIWCCGSRSRKWQATIVWQRLQLRTFSVKLVKYSAIIERKLACCFWRNRKVCLTCTGNKFPLPFLVVYCQLQICHAKMKYIAENERFFLIPIASSVASLPRKKYVPHPVR